MYQTTTHLCELKHCGKPCEHTTICHDHVTELENELAAFRTEELDRLIAIARGNEKPADITRRSNGKGSKLGPSDVLSLPTLQLANNIRKEWPQLLPYLAIHPRAAKLYWTIKSGCETARIKINGLYPDHRDPAYQEAMRSVRYPMKAGELIKHMQDTYNVRITQSQLRKWTQRGKLQPIEVEGSNHHLYNPKQVLELL